MSAIWMRARAEMRARWGAWLGLALLIGTFGGAVIAAAAGARRTDSAFTRFTRTQRAHDVGIGFPVGPGSPPPDLEAVERLPEVAEAARLTAFETEELGTFGVIAPWDGRFGRTVSQWKVVQGRLPRTERVDEAVVPFRDARRLGVEAGGAVRLRFRSADGRRLVPLTFNVVGIVASPLDFSTTTVAVFPTPAFHSLYGDGLLRTLEATFVRLKRGARDLDAFFAGFDRVRAAEGGLAFRQEEEARKVRRGFHVQASALWVLAGFLGIATALVIGQALSRQASLDASEHPTLRAVGMTRGQLFGVAMLKPGIAGLAGAGFAAGVAFLLSPVAPIGDVRVAEPRPGLAFDAGAIGAGAGGALALVGLLAIVPALRSGRARSILSGGAQTSRPSAAASALARAGLPPTMVTGARLALEPGGGRSAVPVRSSLLGVTLGLAALAMALSFDASLTHLLDTPRLYGMRWGAVVELAGPEERATVATALRNDPEVEAFALGEAEGSGPSTLAAEVDGLQGVGALALDGGKGSILPPVIEGRAPSGPDEIVLATETLRRLRKAIGDVVQVRIFGEGPEAFRVSGVAASRLSVTTGDSGRGRSSPRRPSASGSRRPARRR